MAATRRNSETRTKSKKIRELAADAARTKLGYAKTYRIKRIAIQCEPFAIWKHLKHRKSRKNSVEIPLTRPLQGPPALPVHQVNLRPDFLTNHNRLALQSGAPCGPPILGFSNVSDAMVGAVDTFKTLIDNPRISGGLRKPSAITHATPRDGAAR